MPQLWAAALDEPNSSASCMALDISDDVYRRRFFFVLTSTFNGDDEIDILSFAKTFSDDVERDRREDELADGPT